MRRDLRHRVTARHSFAFNLSNNAPIEFNIDMTISYDRTLKLPFYSVILPEYAAMEPRLCVCMCVCMCVYVCVCVCVCVKALQPKRVDEF